MIEDDLAWPEDRKLIALLGEVGAAQFRSWLDSFPDSVGILWAVRDGDGRIVDFSFGYGNPAILRAFSLPASSADKYTLLEALPQLDGHHSFAAYARVCDTGEPWVHEVTYDTPFGDGYMLGTFIERCAQARGRADQLPHRRHRAAPDGARAAQLRRRRRARPQRADRGHRDARRPARAAPEQPPPAAVLHQLRTSTDRAREMIDGVLVYARAGELTRSRSRSPR